MSVSLNHAGRAHAATLVGQGAVDNSGSWSGPSSSEGDTYIKTNGIASYGKWFLGVDGGVPDDTKGHYKYPYSSNFKDVNVKGLKAAASRAGQQGASDIESAAQALLSKADPKYKGNKAKATVTKNKGQNIVEITIE